MKKPFQTYDRDIPVDDYKLESVMKRDQINFESPNIWVYIGADCTNPRYAKVGITKGDLKTRSYSSANPNYYLFCAFQCDQKTTQIELKCIEQRALKHLDGIFCLDNGQTKRVRHKESQYLSECYYDIDFEDFFVCLHNFLMDNYASYFQIGGIVTDDGSEDGYDDGSYALSWLFNPILDSKTKDKYLSMILRY